MSERVFLGASGELDGSAPEGGDEDAAGDGEEGRMGGGGCLVGVEHRAEVRMGTERGSEEGVAIEEGGRFWWCAREDICEIDRVSLIIADNTCNNFQIYNKL